MLQTPEDIARIQITGTPYRVGDVATIEDGVAEDRQLRPARRQGRDHDRRSASSRAPTSSRWPTTSRPQLKRIFASRPRSTLLHPAATSRHSSRNRPNGAIEELLIAVDRGDAGGAGVLPRHAQHAGDGGRSAGDYDRHLRGDQPVRRDDQPDLAAGALAVGRPGDRRRDCGARKYLPPYGARRRPRWSRPAAAPPRSRCRCWR